ncbi:hypothetical protein C7447_101502 [Tenacibaculum adriaticum]|uniref:Glycosyltransferase 2-like domain-containing protein n=1 Tax=Tenacibaculum adriaticum TaxID=413713 RepID=A0A5S5DVN2_9FLAO|nr:glycosyltransferase family 2 protein [Tenacibaculum adriaticum]TYP99895.1 hypothetical protein C7447_101502 [Tenacibaculum adriaticum]
MNTKTQISSTIVLYNENYTELKKTVDSFLQIPFSKKLFLIDNSKENILQEKFNHPETEYVFNNKNIGFSKANNQVIDHIKNYSNYHLILNPDVVFESGIISELIHQLEKDETLTMISPKVEYPNGKYQFTARKYPAFLDLIIRRLNVFKTRVHQQEYRDLDLSRSFYPDFIHGCFMLFKTDDFVKINGFDERYFLYMEDVDICKKIDNTGKRKMYYPNVKIQHVKRQGSSKKIKLLYYHLSSAYKYFKKWGLVNKS